MKGLLIYVDSRFVIPNILLDQTFSPPFGY